MKEVELERDIEFAMRMMVASPDRETKLTAWSALKFFHRLRTPETIKRMEADRGLK